MRLMVACLSILICAVVLADAPRFTALQSVLGTPASSVSDVSNSGFVIGGTASYLFRVNLNDGTVVVLQPYPGATTGSVNAVSEQGIVVGQVVLDSRGRATVWDSQGAPRLLLQGLTTDYFSMATDISPDSAYIAGWLSIRLGARVQVFRVDEEGVRLFGEPAGSAGTQYAYTISGDGQTLGGIAMMPHPTRRVLFGGRELPLVTTRGILWRADGAILTLNGVNNGFSTEVKSLSWDGRIAGGAAELGDFPTLVRVPALWRDGHLDTLDTREGTVWSINATGKRAVGVVREGNTTHAFLWTIGRGVEPIAQRFVDVIPAGWRLTNAAAISPDGRTIVGMGVNPEGVADGWILHVPIQTGDVNDDGCVDDADLLAVLFVFNQTGLGLAEDLNDDGIVDDADLLLVLFNFMEGC